jgi:transcription initiation factor TFIID subunit 7
MLSYSACDGLSICYRVIRKLLVLYGNLSPSVDILDAKINLDVLGSCAASPIIKLPSLDGVPYFTNITTSFTFTASKPNTSFPSLSSYRHIAVDMASPTSVAPSKPKIRIRLGSLNSTPTQTPITPSVPLPLLPPAESPKQKRKYAKKPKKPPQDPSDPTSAVAPSTTKAGKKRARKDANDDGDTPKPKQPKQPKQPKSSTKLSLSLTSLKATEPPSSSTLPAKVKTPTLLKLKTKPAAPKSTPILRLKSKGSLGAPPPRLPGHGYDSEADDVETDPAIEHQFVIRMMPGEDCDWLRKAVSERTIGSKDADVKLNFLDRDGRHAMLSLRGKHYAASLVDLPCVTESHKSWDRKNFFKVADIHQMLIVTKQVSSPAEAKEAPPPEGVDTKNWQWPHGLTPPLHQVRKRRFRKRISNRTIEAVEEEVERLLRLDKESVATQFELFEPHARDESEEAQEDMDIDMDMDMDAEGEVDMSVVQESIELADVDEMARLMAMELEKDDFDHDADADADGEDDVDYAAAVATTQIIHQSPDVMQTATETPPEQVAVSPAAAAAASGSDDTADEDDESDEDEVEIDDDERAVQQERAQLREEIEDIKKEVETVNGQIALQFNRILREKLLDKKAKLKRDLQLKLANLGETDDDDED